MKPWWWLLITLLSFTPFSTLTHKCPSEQDEGAKKMRHGGREDLLSCVMSRPGAMVGSISHVKTVLSLILHINLLDLWISVRLVGLWLPSLLFVLSVNLFQSSGSSPAVTDVWKINTNILENSLALFFSILRCNLPSAADWKIFGFDSGCLTFSLVTDGIESVSLSLWDKNTSSY